MNPTRIALARADFFLRNVRARLPFRYGKATLVAMPLLHVRLAAVGEDGKRVEGHSADCLPPKWFDKDPAKTYRDNINDMLSAIRIGSECYLRHGASPDSVFLIWRRAHEETVARAQASGLNGLTSSFGSSLMERAAMDAACKLAGMAAFDWIREGGLGLNAEEVHSELAGRDLSASLPNAPPEHLYVRQTVGLADPIWERDIAEADQLNDGLPQSIEAWIRDAGVRYLKVKINGDLAFDLPRLGAIANLLERAASKDHAVSLDGNEVFKTVADFESWMNAAGESETLRRFWEHVLYIEQPLDRSVALSPEVASELADLRGTAPVVIDESDDHLDSFKRAAELGYRGTSVKNCKGPIKGILNKLLVDHLSRERGTPFLLTGEDLANLPVVPLQQDLATIGILGLEHAERNGHHFFHGLDHLTESERRACLSEHSSLYEPFGSSARLAIREGRIRTRSLHSSGFGACMAPDFGSMVPLADWDFEMLGVRE